MTAVSSPREKVTSHPLAPEQDNSHSTAVPPLLRQQQEKNMTAANVLARAFSCAGGRAMLVAWLEYESRGTFRSVE